MSTTIMHHQPVLDFHTGILAKLWAVAAVGGVFLVHDLDTLREKGSDNLQVPKPRGGDCKVIRLIQEKPSRDKCFTVGPVTVAYPRRLEEALVSLANGKVKGEFRRRALYFTDEFEGLEFTNVCELNLAILEWVLPFLEMDFPPTVKLSAWLEGREWSLVLEHFLEYYPDYADALSELGIEYRRLPLWGWDRQNKERFQVTSLEEAYSLLREGRLIPKGRELVWLIRGELGYPMIRGLGGESYEAPLEKMAQKLGKRLAPTVTITSRQGVPSKWRGVVRDPYFRPSALLLWLMEGYFDPIFIIRR